MILELIKVTIFTVPCVSIITLVGRRIIRLFDSLDEEDYFSYALSYLVGLATFVYGLVFLGLLGLFHFWPISIYLIFWVFLSILEILKLTPSVIFDAIKNTFKNIISVRQWLFFFLILLGVVNYIACFAPPYAWDEVAYHLPEAKWIISEGKISFPVNDNLYYGNLPVSMEVLYAFSILFSGNSLAHVMHYTFVLALLISIYSFLKKRYSSNVGLLACVFTFFLTGFLENATTGYIDAATTTFEIISLLLIIGWLEKEKDNYLYLSGLFYGLSLNVKYTPLYSMVGYIFIIVLAIAIKGNYRFSNLLKISLKFFIFAFVGGGFWYIKNLVLFQNPVYPLIFGHPGLGDASVEEWGRSIKQFIVPRDMVNFIKIPYSFFLSRMSSLQDIFVFSSFILAPIALINKKTFKMTIILLCIGFINLVLWFFVISHQTRFLFSTLVILTMLSAIAFSMLGLFRSRNLIILLIALSIVFYFIRIVPLGFVVRAIYTDLIKANEIGLLSGKISKTDYLAGKLGSFMYVTDYINKNYTDQTVINFWNHNAHFYLENGNKYILDTPMNESEYAAFLRDRKIALLAIDLGMRRHFIYNPNWNGWREPRLKFEEYFINNAHLIYKYKGGALFKINRPYM